MDLAWWIAVIGVPLVGVIFAVDGIIHAKATESARLCHQRIDAMQKEFADYKVNSAMLFAQVALVREVKDDLVKVLDRIEGRLTGIEQDLREDRGGNHVQRR
jgi:predicted TIM-barrel enzyme